MGSSNLQYLSRKNKMRVNKNGTKLSLFKFKQVKTNVSFTLTGFYIMRTSEPVFTCSKSNM